MGPLISIPIFPLPNVVFFPDTLLPLHIFEPRYRAMTAEALAGDRRIGMVLLKPGWEAQYHESPEAFSVGSMGRIGQYEHLDTGRYNIVLTGEHKFRIERYTQETPFRIAEVTVLHDDSPEGDSPILQRRKVALVQLYKALLRDLSAGDVSPLDALLSLPLRHVVNVVASGLSISVYDKQTLLEMDSMDARYQSIVTIIKSQLAASSIYRDFRALAPEDPRIN